MTAKEDREKARRAREALPKLSASAAAAAAFDEVKNLDFLTLHKARFIENAMHTGSLVLDLILGGGLKAGFFTTLFGPEGSGKSTMVNALAAAAQAQGIPIVFFDPENTADPVYMSTMGVDIHHPDFYYSNPETGEEIYRHILHTLSRMPAVPEGSPVQILFLIDSIEGMASEEVDEVGDGGRIADEARMHSYYLKRVIPKLRKRAAHIVGTNQMRTNIGGYGAPLKEAGGKALMYWAGYKIKTSAQKLEDDKKTGSEGHVLKTLPVLWRTQKNKVFPAFRSAEMRILLGRGFDLAYDAKSFLKQLGYFENPGGKNKILVDWFEDCGKTLSWAQFRHAVEQPEFRAQCRKMLLEPDTYRRYFETCKEETYFYDDLQEGHEFDAWGETPDDVKTAQAKEAAAKLKKTSKGKGKGKTASKPKAKKQRPARTQTKKKGGAEGALFDK